MTTYRAGIILIANEQMLLVKTIHNGTQEIWGFPKGRIHKGDTPKQTAEREFLEETGICFSLEEGYKHIRLSNAHFYVKHISNALPVHYDLVPDKKEIKDIQWMCIDDIIKLAPTMVNRYVRMYLHKQQM